MSTDAKVVEAIDNSVKYRKIGCQEMVLKVLHDEGHLILSNALWVVSKEPLTEDVLRRACTRLSMRIPQLQSRIDANTKDGPAFVPMDHFNIDLKSLESSDWIEVLTEEWKQKFDTNTGPLWRMKFLPKVKLQKADNKFPHESVIVFTCFHPLCDGMSYQRIFGYILDCLDDVKNNVMDEPKPFQVFPALEHYLNMEDTYRDSFPIQPGQIQTKSPIHCWLHPIEFTQEETSTIVKSCKARATTVNGALCIAASVEFAKYLQKKTSEEEEFTIHSHCPINMRSHIKGLIEHQEESIGLYVYFTNVEQKINLKQIKEDFWGLVIDYNTQVKKDIADKGCVTFTKQMYQILSEVVASGKQAGEQFDTGEEAFMLTNMGRCDFLTRSDECHFKLVGRFGGGGSMPGTTLTHNLNTFNDMIYWSIIYSTEFLQTEDISDLANNIKETLRAHCN